MPNINIYGVDKENEDFYVDRTNNCEMFLKDRIPRQIKELNITSEDIVVYFIAGRHQKVIKIIIELYPSEKRTPGVLKRLTKLTAKEISFCKTSTPF